MRLMLGMASGGCADSYAEHNCAFLMPLGPFIR